MKKKLGLIGRLIAVSALVPTALMAGSPARTIQGATSTQGLSASCARFCRDVCIANGEPCCILGPNTCGCC